jgi:hypothetical protein
MGNPPKNAYHFLHNIAESNAFENKFSRTNPFCPYNSTLFTIFAAEAG